jgi:prepilin-type N-terminal cleavage/methylation domain-containing protein
LGFYSPKKSEEKNMKKKAFTLIELLVVVAIIALLIAILLPALGRAREMGRRAQCGSNIRQIGLGLNTYAQENGERLPSVPWRSGALGQTNVVGTGTDTAGVALTQSGWRRLSAAAGTNADPFTATNTQQNSNPISASLWLLCRYNMSTPKVFVCPSVKGKSTSEDDLYADSATRNVKYFADFKVDSIAGQLITYSFQLPWSKGWRTSGKPGFIVGGDENNGKSPEAIDPATDPTPGNSVNHASEGQNVLGIDASGNFAKRPNVGINEDNIYTSQWSSTVSDQGKPQLAGVKNVNPWSNADTVLIPVSSSVIGATNCVNGTNYSVGSTAWSTVGVVKTQQ